MYYNKNGLGDTVQSDIKKCAEKVGRLKPNDEISFTSLDFVSGQLYDSVLKGLESAHYIWVLGCAVHRWFRNKDTHVSLKCDFRPDVIIIKREKESLK